MITGSSFEEIVENIDCDLVCCYSDCESVAQYHIDFHRCARHECCGFHTGALVQIIRTGLSEYGQVRCSSCQEDFLAIEDLVTIIPI